uniref:Uncharacterized protein n=1 Tax=Chaetoceros debilis TaxID=122233 RepID=A0A6S8VWD7_9STRA|mmetsp:Transcript_22399/g.33095  ORF Transcript_22399/g.33095 Transcript_22399/m.33095 type:complete len:345 (+) Transcript_22399:53-1087(+)|eukprot:CAMPEP_0194073228 /NCGR_PEP_ID=MMETSP0149-20130528/729_1 /TAXON_ID=122233 /ORGANISM="Chaetoceros debilis, Strain MM31A-1" /LENGTH=344 /DNA_ID=CAMNT_0038753217 /DNA_START=52 /DNA_END=1086 /DNA_ORIENTATION=+
MIVRRKRIVGKKSLQSIFSCVAILLGFSLLFIFLRTTPQIEQHSHQESKHTNVESSQKQIGSARIDNNYNLYSSKKLDGLLTNDQLQSMQNSCPQERKLYIGEDKSLSEFIEEVLRKLNLATLNARPIDELSLKFPEISESFQTIQTGFWAEFGVFQGLTLGLAAKELLKLPEKKQRSFQGVMAGFDSFQGLPEVWRDGFTKGAFGKRKNLYQTVRSKLPDDVELYKGWFQDTIGSFKKEHPRMPATFIHHDGDLFISAVITFQLLTDRIVPGTHMIFDELIGYPDYEKHEMLALYLWMIDHDVTLCVRGHKSPILDLEEFVNVKKDIHAFEQSAWFQVLSLKN